MALRQPSGHGGSNRGLEAGALPGVPFGRFGRMFDPQGAFLDDECLAEIAGAMIKDDVSKPINEDEPIDENPTIPSGYTYFGQFIDHDITFDPTPLNAQSVDVEALEDFRSPALNLDNVYGRGPDEQPYLYAGNDTLLPGGETFLLATGDDIPGPAAPGVPVTKFDVLRLGSRTPAGGQVKKRLAVLGDKRNDENRLVAQIQATMIAFHNRVMRTDSMIARATAQGDNALFRFRAAVDIVRWHYQWLVLWDYLDRRLLKPATVTRVLNPGGTPRLSAYLKLDAKYPYMPVEFSGAAFRTPHSMVRPGYALNEIVGSQIPAPGTPPDVVERDFHRVSIFSRGDALPGGGIDLRANLNGFGLEIPDFWGLDWRFFLDGVGGPTLPDLKLPQPSYRIDANLVQPLSDLPEFRGDPVPAEHNLAFRNLKRGVQNLRLPSGEQVAYALGLSGADIVPQDKIWTAGSRAYDPQANPLGDLDAASARRSAAAQFCRDKGVTLEGNTPLWYYVLREAEDVGIERQPADPLLAAGGQHLGAVGSELVAQTLIGLLWLDDNSFLNRMPSFQPFPELLDGGAAQDFSLGKLVKWAWENPNG